MTDDIRELTSEAKIRYYNYGVYVNEERAIPSEIDGLKPVARRALWSLYKKGGHSNAKLQKTAVYVGDCMGSYHPHGDKSIADTFTSLVRTPHQLVYGEGNWGSLSDKSVAAMRYTLLKLTKFSESMFFDKFYLPVMQEVPNYDGSKQEPLTFVSLLPNVLLNGTLGIGVGVRAQLPSFTLKSVIQAVILSLKDKKVSFNTCKGLDFRYLYGGIAVKDKQEFASLIKSGKGKFNVVSTYVKAKEKDTWHIESFAPFSALEKAIEKVILMKEISNVNDISDIKDAYGRIEIKFKKGIAETYQKTLMDKIVSGPFGSTENYDIKVTTRFIDDKGLANSKLQSSNIINILSNWIAYRIQLEKTACSYWIKKRNAEIDHLNLMRLAVKNRAFIIKALDKPFDDEQLAAYLAKHLKITVEQANIILDLKIRALKSLEDKKLVKKIKELKDEIKSYKQRIAKPRVFIANQLKDFYKEFKDL
mgnify:CR=1 FL=1